MTTATGIARGHGRTGAATALLVCALLAGSASAQERGYKPLTPRGASERDDGYRPLLPDDDEGEDPTRRGDGRDDGPDLPDDEPFVPGEPIPRISLGAYFRTGFLRGGDVGHDDGEFVDAPELDKAFGPGYGLGLTVLYSIIPMLAIQYDASFQVHEGRRVSRGVVAGGAVTFGDLWVMHMDVGPRLQLPLELPGRFWDEAHSIPSIRGIVPYIRLGAGVSLSSDVDAEFTATGGSRFWASTGSFRFVAALGTEIVGESWGLHIEVVGFEKWGPLGAAKEPEARDVDVFGFPVLAFGLTHRF